MTETASPPSPARSARWPVAAIMAGVNALLFFTVLYDDLTFSAATEAEAAGLGMIARYAIAMVLGGALAGYMLAGLFGRPGIPGWIKAALGGLLATMLAGLAGSLIGHLPDNLANGFQVADLIPVVSGLLILPFAFADLPILVPICIALIAAAHLWARRMRG